ncbi:MAG: futalosine hydrolase [Odoribacter sp.]|nr:futalosine hydrolase [Odoribacter sp.]
MGIRVLIVFATSDEAGIIKKMKGIITSDEGCRIGRFTINFLVTGVGGISTAWAMKQWLSNNTLPDLAINAGIAGSYSTDLKIGDVVMPVTDCFADMGIESGDKFMTLDEAGLINPDKYLFEGGVIHSRNKYIESAGNILKKVNGITVNTCSGSSATIERLKNKFNPDIETMEGATFFYICAREKIPFLSLRAISNRVEPRNRASWDIPLALENLAGKMNELLLMLE